MTFNKNKFMYIIMACIVMFIIDMYISQQTGYPTGAYFAVQRDAVLDYHEYYRLISYAFVHGGVMHLLVNMIALSSLSDIVIRFTSEKFSLIIYFIAALVSGITVVMFTTAPTVGSSGAIYGLFGILIYYALKQRKHGYDEMFKSLMPVILINVLISFMPGISLAGHAGGLVAGLVGSFIYDRKKRSMY